MNLPYLQGSGVEIPTIHARQELGYDPSFHFPLSTFTFWGDGINLVDEQEARCSILQDQT